MRFPYSSVISTQQADGAYLLIRRPEIPISVIGSARTATYIGLVDTGSDNTILPKSVADYLGIAIEPAIGSAAIVFGGHQVQLFEGQVRLRLEVEGETVAWDAIVCFYDLPPGVEETIILGHAGFLDYFTAEFDGEFGILTLVANAELPAI